MTTLISRFAPLFVAAVALIAGEGAWAQLTVTDGVTTKTSCTGYTVSSVGSTTITLTPNNCLAATSSGPEPVFSLRLTSNATTQSATELRKVYVFVDADREVPATPYTLTFNLCTSSGCNSATDNWSFFPYAELGGKGFLPQNKVTTGSYTFTFVPGAHTSPTNLQSMGIGEMDVPSAPLFEGTRNVTFGLSGTNAVPNNLVMHVITGGLQQVAGVELDINNNPIPAPTGPVGAQICNEYYFQPRGPGSGPGPCGAYEIPVGNCSSGMTGANAITKAWLYILEDYTKVPASPRIGNSIRMGVPRNHAFVFKFKTGPAGTFPALGAPPFYQGTSIAFNELVNMGAQAPRFVALSEAKCDFDYTKISETGGKNGCYRAFGGDSSLLARIYPSASVPSPASILPSCPLKPDTAYYMSFRYEDARAVSSRGTLSCPTSTCGANVVIN